MVHIRRFDVLYLTLLVYFSGKLTDGFTLSAHESHLTCVKQLLPSTHSDPKREKREVCECAV